MVVVVVVMVMLLLLLLMLLLRDALCKFICFKFYAGK